MSSDVGKVTESRAHSPTFPSLHLLRHSSFSNPSVALPTSQFILQPFRCFTYVTTHYPTFPSLHLRHSSLSSICQYFIISITEYTVIILYWARWRSGNTLDSYSGGPEFKPPPLVDPGGPVVIILSSGSEVRGFDPGLGRWIFSGRKNPEYDFLRKGSKVVGPVS